MAKNVWLKKFLLTMVGKPMYSKMEKAAKNCKLSQETVLKEIIEYGKNTAFGREHNFVQIGNYLDYQKNVPICTYEDLRPYMERCVKGEENVLFPGKPVMLATTSGTTKEPKWIPISEKYFDECYKGLSKLWLYSCVKDNPHIFDGHDLSIVGKAVEGYTESGIMYGSMSGHQYTQIPGFMKDIHVVPYDAYEIDDYESKYYCLIRFTIEHSISYAITPNPSTLLQIIKEINARSSEIIEDIEMGTLSRNITISAEIRKTLESCLKPNPKRAAELKKMLSQHGKLLPRHFWPELALVNIWRSGNNVQYLKQLDGAFADKTVIREFAYQASEARAGIVLDNDSLSSIMVCHMLYFEFIRESDMGQPSPRIYQAWELEKGGRYNIIISTTSGLYRYNMNDILEVDGFFHEFPKLRFVQKGAGVTSLTGEKLYECQFIDAVSEACQNLSMAAGFFIGFADLSASHYRIFVEFEKEYKDSDYKKFIEKTDELLRRYNIEYEAKRASKRIKSPVLHILEYDAFQKFKIETIRQAGREGQFKLVHLLQDDNKMKMFGKLTIKTFEK